MPVKNLYKIAYDSPVIEVIEVKQEGNICDSGVIPDIEHGWELDFEPASNLGLEIDY